MNIQERVDHYQKPLKEIMAVLDRHPMSTMQIFEMIVCMVDFIGYVNGGKERQAHSTVAAMLWMQYLEKRNEERARNN